MYQAGTLSGNPLAMIAGLTTLTTLKKNPNIYQELNGKTEYLEMDMRAVLDRKGIPYRINRLGSMISLHFTAEDVVDFASASRADIPKFNQLFHHMLDNGVYLPPSAYEAWFLNNALNVDDLDHTVDTLASFLDTI